MSAVLPSLAAVEDIDPPGQFPVTYGPTTTRSLNGLHPHARVLIPADKVGIHHTGKPLNSATYLTVETAHTMRVLLRFPREDRGIERVLNLLEVAARDAFGGVLALDLVPDPDNPTLGWQIAGGSYDDSEGVSW